MSNRLIDLIGINKSFDNTMVLDDLNLYIRENEFLTLLGPSPAVARQQPCVSSAVLKHRTAVRCYLAVKISLLFRPTKDSSILFSRNTHSFRI